ncbi:MAG TPA: FAD-binding oxidoreductase [Candidatus Eisenbacteria bacterium]|nr:FAD-binding oxidoreductase [Candidatus Eisenbacteria bacterium]
MLTHEDKVARIAGQLRRRTSRAPVSLKKKAVSHEVPKLHDKRHDDEKIDISDLNEVLRIDAARAICVAEPGVTFVDLVKETMKHGLVPIVVPELKTITIGGAVAGCSIESMSYVYGGFHDTCLEYEVVTAKGDVLMVTPTNEHALVFQMMHGTFGTLGIITKLTFRLVPAKKFVHVRYEKHPDLESYKASIRRHYESRDVDFMDGIIHSPSELVLSVGNFVDEAPYAHRYDWMRVYYLSTRKRKEDYLRTADYFFRYDKGVTNVTPRSFLGRLFLGKFVDSTTVLKLVYKLRKYMPSTMIPVTLDTFIPFSKMTEFFEWYEREIDFFPLWCVPYKRVRTYEWINDDFIKKAPDDLYLDIAIYGFRRQDGKNYYKMFEEELMSIGGLKTLITPNYYSEEDFWKIWNKTNYDQVKRVTDPDNIFRDLYAKMVRAARGL